MVRLDINNGTQHDMCLFEIGLRAQNLSTIRSNSQHDCRDLEVQPKNKNVCTFYNYN